MITKEQIEKEAVEYAYAFGNGIFSDGLYKGFVDSFNSKISERIKVEFAIKFATWYSGMDESKVKKAFDRYLEETNTPICKECAKSHTIKDL